MSAPYWSAIEHTIAESRALVSAAELDLWLFRKTSPMRPSGEPADRAGVVQTTDLELEGLGAAAIL
jgi:hypothetical protein